MTSKNPCNPSLMWRQKHYSEPAGRHNAISYEAFCQLGALNNPALVRVSHQNGSHQYNTYHKRSY